MQAFPRTTSIGEHGLVHVVALNAECELRCVPPSLFDVLAPACASVSHGHYYVFAEGIENRKRIILIKNARRPHIEDIDRDDAWHRRRELACALNSILINKDSLTPSDINHRLPLSLLTLLYREAFCE